MYSPESEKWQTLCADEWALNWKLDIIWICLIFRSLLDKSSGCVNYPIWMVDFWMVDCLMVHCVSVRLFNCLFSRPSKACHIWISPKIVNSSLWTCWDGIYDSFVVLKTGQNNQTIWVSAVRSVKLLKCPQLLWLLSMSYIMCQFVKLLRHLTCRVQLCASFSGKHKASS